MGANGTSFSDQDVAALRGRVAGAVILPGEDGWDDGRAAYNLCANLEPAAIVVASSAADVVEAVRFAGDQGLRVAPVSTGHGATCFGDLEGVLLIRTGGLDDVEIVAGERVARVGAGARWADVVGPAAEHGLVGLHGSSGTVGVVGYSVMGGLGWLARSHGLACNSVLGFEVVTADGERREVTAEADPELFWALRGGGGSHAIVTRIDVALFELSKFYGGSLIWELDHLPEVAQAWLEWTADAPEELFATIKAARFPPLPELPEPLRGKELAMLTFVYSGDSARGEELLAGLRAKLPEPYLDTVAEQPTPALTMIAGDPPDPVPATGGGVLLDEVGEAMISAWSDAALAAKSMLVIELRRLGGALSRAADGAGALARIPADASLYAVAATPTPDAITAASAELESLLERVAPWVGEQTLLPFAEQQPGLSTSFPADVAARLRAVKAEYDPDGLILGNHIDELS